MESEPQALIDTIATHDTAWYRELWKGATTFSLLPQLNREDFVRTPLSKRRYKDEKALVKVVHTPTGPFLSEWAFSDIAKEPWSLVSDRPFVYLTDSHSAVEKSMWCYEQDRIPLIGEKNPDIAAVAAKKYQIDSLIADPESVEKLSPYLEARAEKLKSLTLVGDSFIPQTLMPLARYTDEVRLVLALSETGVLGVAPLIDVPRFVPPANCVVEEIDGQLVFTKTSLLVTPIIRYAPGIVGAVDSDGTFTIHPHA